MVNLLDEEETIFALKNIPKDDDPEFRIWHSELLKLGDLASDLAMKRMEELEKANGIQRKKSPEPNVSGFYDRIIESKKFGPNYTPASKKKAETAEGPP